MWSVSVSVLVIIFLWLALLLSFALALSFISRTISRPNATEVAEIKNNLLKNFRYF